MTKKTRYFLLAACVLFFLIVAPLMVLYVRGVTFNFKTRTFVATGILAVRSVPNNVDIYLDGRQRRSSAGDLRFVAPGEHEVTLKKSGYGDWSKRLLVEPGQVVWANPAFGSIYLLMSKPPVISIATGVRDFYYQNGRALLLTKNNLLTVSGTGLKNQQIFSLPQPADSIIADDAGGKNFILSGTYPPTGGATSSPAYLFFNTDSGKFTKLSGLFSGQTEFKFSDSGRLYALNKEILYSIDPENLAKHPLFNEVDTFSLQGSSVYFIQNSATSTTALIISQAPFNQTQTLFASLPPFSKAQLFITYQKQIFLLADNNLYLLNNSMQELADNVSLCQFEPSSSLLAVLHSGELDYFDPLSGNLNFVTRSSVALSNLQIRPGIGYAIFQKDQEIDAVELDTRDRQNQYVLYNGTDIKKSATDSGGQNLVVLDGDELKIVTIR